MWQYVPSFEDGWTIILFVILILAERIIFFKLMNAYEKVEEHLNNEQISSLKDKFKKTNLVKTLIFTFLIGILLSVFLIATYNVGWNFYDFMIGYFLSLAFTSFYMNAKSYLELRDVASTNVYGGKVVVKEPSVYRFMFNNLVMLSLPWLVFGLVTYRYFFIGGFLGNLVMALTPLMKLRRLKKLSTKA